MIRELGERNKSANHLFLQFPACTRVGVAVTRAAGRGGGSLWQFQCSFTVRTRLLLRPGESSAFLVATVTCDGQTPTYTSDCPTLGSVRGNLSSLPKTEEVLRFRSIIEWFKERSWTPGKKLSALDKCLKPGRWENFCQCSGFGLSPKFPNLHDMMFDYWAHSMFLHEL